MILHVYRGKACISVRGRAQAMRRLARSIRSSIADCTVVLSDEDRRDTPASRRELLHAMADAQEAEFLAALQAGLVPEPIA